EIDNVHTIGDGIVDGADNPVFLGTTPGIVGEYFVIAEESFGSNSRDGANGIGDSRAGNDGRSSGSVSIGIERWCAGPVAIGRVTAGDDDLVVGVGDIGGLIEFWKSTGWNERRVIQSSVARIHPGVDH